MSLEFEYELDPQTMVMGEVIETDESFSDLDQHYPKKGYELKDLQIITYLDGSMELNITEMVKKTYPEYFKTLKNEMLAKYSEQFLEGA